MDENNNYGYRVLVQSTNIWLYECVFGGKQP